ncbi:MAG: carbohydrate-binding protein, partial [Gracilimonas sp.]
NPEDWTIKSGGMQYGSRGNFNTPNHIAPVVELDDGTSWVIGHSYHRDWVTQGRQGLLLEVTYDEDGFPEFQYPQDAATTAPNLSSSGIPWMIPKSDMFNETIIKPHWSFLGFTPDNSYSLTERPGSLYLSPHNGENYVLQNDGEHQYSLITFVDFEPETESHEAGLMIINGPESIEAKVFSSADSEGNRMLKFSYQDVEHQVENNIESKVWLKLTRDEHKISGYYSSDGNRWFLIGSPVEATALNEEQTDFNNFTGNQQGLYVRGKAAYFDTYIYRDAYSAIAAQYPVNFSGVSRNEDHLGSIHSGDWALYAGVEFGDENPPKNGYDYQRTPDKLRIEASSANNGGTIEVWIDSIDTGQKISEHTINNTGSWNTFIEFSTDVDSVNGRHDVYLRFTGNEDEELLRLKQFRFTPRRVPISTTNEVKSEIPGTVKLNQNYPNPFNPNTVISYQLPMSSKVSIKVFDMLGREVATLVDEQISAGEHRVSFDASTLSSGMYIYRINAGDFVQSRKMMLIK